MPHGEARGRLEVFDRSQQNEIEWHVQRVAVVLLTLLLVAIALGLFGRGGPLSTVRTGDGAAGLAVEYDRFMRYHSPDQLRVLVKAKAQGQLRLVLAGEYVRQLQIERITPQPEQELAVGGNVVFVFTVPPGETLDATLYFSPNIYGPLAGWIAVEGGVRQPLSHFVYP